MIARLMFSIVNFAARKGLAESGAGNPSEPSPKERARRTGLRGETYAYWYLRRHGYVFVARNYSSPGIKGEIDMIGYDGPVLAFVEVKTRDATEPDRPDPEQAVNAEKRHHLARVARQFLRSRRAESGSWRFDVVAIETRAGKRPEVRLHKGAFIPDSL
jgi:putative endonuclease